MVEYGDGFEVLFFRGERKFFFLNGEKRGASKGGFFRIGQQHKQKSAYIFFFFFHRIWQLIVNVNRLGKTSIRRTRRGITELAGR